MEPDPIKNKKSTEYQELLAFIHKAITIFERKQYENEKQKDKIYRNYSNGSNGNSNAYAGSGYFYWSYKLLADTVNTPGLVGWDC